MEQKAFPVPPEGEQATKICTKCRTDKPWDEFYRESSRRGGRRADCKACRIAYSSLYYAANRHKRLAYLAGWREANPDKIKAHNTAYYAANREQVKESSTAWYMAHRERAIARQAEWAKANPEKVKVYIRRWRSANPEKLKERWARRSACRRGATIAPFSYEAILWRDGYRCYLCAGEVCPGDHHFDHVVPLSRGGAHSYDNVRVTHAACNLRKGAKLLTAGGQ